MVGNPKVFISYAWEDDIQKWVEKLAENLRSDGVDVMIDQWEVHPGDRLLQFMETSISSSDYVLIICTPKYKIKADCREGGAGFEGDIISSEQYYKGNPRKFIPLLKKGDWQDSAPVFLQSKKYIDFRIIKGKKENYQYLLRTLFDNLPGPPPLGVAPKFLSKSPKGLKKINLYRYTYIAYGDCFLRLLYFRCDVEYQKYAGNDVFWYFTKATRR